MVKIARYDFSAYCTGREGWHVEPWINWLALVEWSPSETDVATNFEYRASAGLAVCVGAVWVGAHPRLGEQLASALLVPGSVYAPLSHSAIKSVRREVKGVAGTDMRYV